ncbi:MAG: beta-galactosidase GalA [Verrucomicrobiota bacterium]
MSVYPEIPDLERLDNDEITGPNSESYLETVRPDPVATHAGENVSFVQTNYNDSGWRQLNLPHDWAVELPFDQTADEGHGYKAVGYSSVATYNIGWYRRTFTIPGGQAGQAFWLEFDGVYRNSMVWFNGHILGRNASGYESFSYDVTPYANPGGSNVLVVRVDATRFEGWFYEGAGIYRHVWLLSANPVHVAHWGTFVATTNLSGVNAGICIQTVITNEGARAAEGTLTSTILDAGSNIVAMTTSAISIPGETNELVTETFNLTNANLWSLQTPYLYNLVSAVSNLNALADTYTTPFGVRTVKFDPTNGVFLNGQPVEIQGMCNHQDHAGVGSALPDRLQYFRIERLKEMGVNACRTSHNAPTPELLDACDQLGMLVLDENRRVGTDAETLGQVQRQIQRDRNHPSVFCWSMGNEENEIEGASIGAGIMSTMVNLVHSMDSTRLCTAGMNSGWGAGFSQVLDVTGFNYNLSSLASYHASYPASNVIGTEVGSTVTTRGIYYNDPDDGYLSAYDIITPAGLPDPVTWGETAETWWPFYASQPWSCGAFNWTGFDYRGEPTPYNWPCISSQFGQMDTCGFPKDSFYYYQANWSPKPVLHLLPHWNWSIPGEIMSVWAYGNCQSAELFLNGVSQGEQNLTVQSHAAWNVPYVPGTLQAIGYNNGVSMFTNTVQTTGTPAGVALKPDRRAVLDDGCDVSVVTVQALDSQGLVVPTANNEIYFSITGGAIIGVGNGDPSSLEADKGSQRALFNGLAEVVVQSSNQPGAIILTATSPGLTSGSVTITAVAALPPPAAPTGVVAMGVGSNGPVALSWDVAPGATGYNVKRATTTNGPWTVLASNIAVLGYTDTSVNFLTPYYYVVSAVSAKGEGINSVAISASPYAFGAGSPGITNQPASEELYTGQTAMFAVGASGAPPLFYQWQSNNLNLSDRLNISGSTTATLTLTNVPAADAATYQVVVSNAFGAVTSSVAMLSLVTPYATNAATYENAVMQANPVAYWRLNETNNPSSGTAVAYDYWGGYNGIYGVASINGVAGPRPTNGLNIFESSNTAVSLAANTTNSCVALPALNLNTNTVTLTCWINPAASPQAAYAGLIYCRSGSTVSGLSYDGAGAQLGFTWNQAFASFTWESGLLPPANQWSLVALVVTPTNATLSLYNTNSIASATLAISNDVQTFAGPTYIGVDPYASARTFNGTIDEVAVFNYAMTPAQVQQLYSGASFGPTITSQPAPEDVYSGQIAQFSVEASGPPPLYYQWQSNNVNLSDGGNISGSTTPTLTIIGVSAANVASYQVVVTNVSGAATSSGAALNLLPSTGSAVEDAILAAGPVAYWLLNETGNPAGGTLVAADYLGGYNGVYGNAVTLGIDGPQPGANFPGFESTNTAMELTGNTAGCYVAVPPLNLDTNTVTITCWINPSASVQPPFAALMFCRDGVTTAGLNFDATGVFLGYTWNGDPATYNWVSGLSPPANQWSFVALVVTPTNAVLYLDTANGPQSATNVYTNVNQKFSGSTLIGDDPYGSPARVFGGALSGVAIFNCALTPAQISRLPDIIYSPAVVINPPGQSVFAGSSCAFTAAAQGSPPLSYQWCLNSVPIPQATNSELSFAGVGTNDSGSYTVQVSNPAGTSTSPPAALLVNPSPTAVNIEVGTLQNQPVAVPTASLLALASDPYGEDLSIVAVTDSANGAPVVWERDQIIYTPLPNFLGMDSFTYTISDTQGATSGASVSVSVVSSNALFVNPVGAPALLPGDFFHVDFLGVPYYTYSVETATNLLGPWTLLTNLTAGSNGILTLATSAATPPPARFFQLPGGAPPGQLSLATGQGPQLNAPQGAVWLDTNDSQSSLALYFSGSGTCVPLISPTVLSASAGSLALQYQATAPGGAQIQVTRALTLNSQLQKTVLLETMTLAATGAWNGDIEIQRPFAWQQSGATVQAFAPLSDGSVLQTNLSSALNQWQYPLGYSAVAATQLALPVMSFTSPTARFGILADPYYSSLFEASLTNGSVQGRVRYTYHTSQVPLGATETRQFGFVLTTNTGSPGAFEDGLNDFYAEMLPDVPAGPAWCKQIAMNGYDFLSDSGHGWTNDIAHLAGWLTPAQKARVVLCMHGWYDGLGHYSFDITNNVMLSNWVAFGPTLQIPMSTNDMRFRLQYARTNGFRVLLYFADGLLSDSGGWWYDPDWVYYDTSGDTIAGWSGPDTFWTTFAMNPANPEVANFYTNYLNALLATYGDLVDGFVWDEMFYIRQGAITLTPAPAYCDVACMKLVKSLRAQVKQYNPQMVFLTADARGFVTDDVPCYAMMADGTYEDLSLTPSLFSYGLFENWRNTVWSCNWYPFTGFANSTNWVQAFGAPVPISNGWGDACGPGEWTWAQSSETMALFYQRLMMAPTTGYFLH